MQLSLPRSVHSLWMLFCSCLNFWVDTVHRACVRARVCVCVCVFLQDYVAKLAKVVTGYVIPMRQRIGQLFDERSINVIFGNMEQIHQLNEKFLRELRTAAENDGVLPLKVVVVS